MEPHECAPGGPTLGPPEREIFGGPLSPSEYPPLPTCGMQQNPVAHGGPDPPTWGPTGAPTWGPSPYGGPWAPSCCTVRSDQMFHNLAAPHDAHLKHEEEHTLEPPSREPLSLDSVGVTEGRQTKGKSGQTAMSSQRGQRTRQQTQRKKHQHHQPVVLRQQHPSQQQTEQWGQHAMRRVWVATSTSQKRQQAGEGRSTEYPAWCPRESPPPDAISETFPTTERPLVGIRDLQINGPLGHPPQAPRNPPMLRRPPRKQESEFPLQQKGSHQEDLNDQSGISSSLQSGALVRHPPTSNNRRPHHRGGQMPQTKQLRPVSQQNARRYQQRRQASSIQSQQWQNGDLTRGNPSLPPTGSTLHRHHRRRLNQQPQQLQPSSRRLNRPMSGVLALRRNEPLIHEESSPYLGNPWVPDVCLEYSVTSCFKEESGKTSLNSESPEAAELKTVIGKWISLSRRTFLHIDAPCAGLEDEVGGAKRRSASAAHASAILQRRESCLKAILHKPHLLGGKQTVVKIKQ